KGQSYLEKHLDLCGSIKRCRLIEILGYCRHTCHIHDHIVSDGLPYKSKDYGIQNYILISHPLLGQASQSDSLKKSIQKTSAGIIDCSKDTGNNYDTQDIGYIENNPEKIFSFEFSP